MRLQYVATTGRRRRVRDMVIGLGDPDQLVAREDLARRYIKGSGIEIGASTFPTRVPKHATVRYVDRLGKEDLVVEYQLMVAASGRPLAAIPATEIIDDAEHLATFGAESLDFIIVNHVLEHLEDPILALDNFARVLRPGGTVLISLPDRRVSFDHLRPGTTTEHVLRDHREGPEVSRQAHYEEWARLVEGAADVPARAAEFAATGARHHFHVWTLAEFLELIDAVDVGLELELGQQNSEEFNVVLRKR